MRKKKPRPKPTGVPGIKQDGPGRFLVRIRWTDPRTGRRRKKERIAETLAESVALKEARGVSVKAEISRQLFAAFVEQWLLAHGGRFADSTRIRYVLALAHAVVALGHFFVDSIEPGDVRQWVVEASRSNAASTVNGWLRVLRVVLDDAVEDGTLARNPARLVRSLAEPRTGGKRGTALSLEEFRRLLEAVDVLERTGKLSGDVARLISTAAWTGARRNELLALKWDDYVEGELRIERSVFCRSEKATKTDDPRRVTVVEPLAQVLAQQRRWLIETQHPGLGSGLIFPASPRHAKGGAERRGAEEVSWYRSPSVMDKPLARLSEEGKLPPISPQSLRRTWENLLREAGIDQLVRRALSGWRTEKAQAIYATVDRQERDAAVRAVQQLVLGKKVRRVSGKRKGTPGRYTRARKRKRPAANRA